MKRQCISGVVAVLLAGCSEERIPTEPQTAAERGLALAAANACVACHTLDGTRGIGPTWARLYGATRTFTDGSTAVADAAYLQRAMREPAAQIVAGFDNVMVPAPVTDAQLVDIIALIEELQDGAYP